MKSHIRSGLVLGFIVALIAVVGSHFVALAAGPTGVYDILNFPGATASNCGTWEVYSSAGVNQPGPSLYTETMTDGYGNVVFSRSQAGGIGFFTFWGSGSFTKQPEANPITEHIVMDGVVIAHIQANNPCAGPAVYQGAPIPEGFMQYDIVCDSAVYDMPGGTAVGENMVKAGQAWHVNTTPETGPDGQSWTEIFVAGLQTGYIPTACVGGPTAFN